MYIGDIGRAVVGLVVTLMVGGCGVFGPDDDIAFYSLIEANGQTVETTEGPVLAGTIPYQDSTCDLLLRLDGGGGYAYVNFGTKTYHLSVTMNIHCEDFAFNPGAEANADERGTFTLRNGRFAIDPTRRTGLELATGTLSGDTLIVEGFIDAAGFVFFQFPEFSVDQQFPIQLTFVKTAED